MATAAVTGGASGLGLALIERCAGLGMDIVVLDLDGDRATREAQRVAEAHGVGALGLGIDVADAAVWIRWWPPFRRASSGVDLVVSNVGYNCSDRSRPSAMRNGDGCLTSTSSARPEWHRAFLPLLRQSERGRLAFTTSSSILDPASRLGAYQASKFAVSGLAETLRLELAEDGIGVSVIFPSGMITRRIWRPVRLRSPTTSADPSPTMVTSMQ